MEVEVRRAAVIAADSAAAARSRNQGGANLAVAPGDRLGNAPAAGDATKLYADPTKATTLPAQTQEWAFRSGLALLLGLMVFVTFNDLAGFGLWERLAGLIG